MSRRVLDQVSITALSNHADDDLTAHIKEMIGPGELVKEAKSDVVKFNKSIMGLTKTDIIGPIRKITREFKLNESKGTIKTSNSKEVKVDSKAISLLKAISFYRVTCHPKVSDCLGNVIQGMDSFFENGKYKDISTTVYEESDTGNYTESDSNNLMKYCKEEIFKLFKEVGVDVE